MAFSKARPGDRNAGQAKAALVAAAHLVGGARCTSDGDHVTMWVVRVPARTLLLLACSAVVALSAPAFAAASPNATYRSAIAFALGKVNWKPCGPKHADSCAYDGDLEVAISKNALAMEVTDFSTMSHSEALNYVDTLGLIVGVIAGPASITWFGQTEPKVGQSVTKTFGSWVVEQKLLSANHTTLQVGVAPKS